MRQIIDIVLFFQLICFYSYGQGLKNCENSFNGIKTITILAENGSLFIPDKEIEFYNEKGQHVKTEIYYDTLFSKIDTFIYSADEKLLWRKTIDPEIQHITQKTEFLYNGLGVNYRSIVTSIDLLVNDSLKIDTLGYNYVRYDFIRNPNNLFTERKTYFSNDNIKKIAEFDTSKFDITYQSWQGDSIFIIEDHFADRIERLRNHYLGCKLFRVEFFDENDNITEVYDHEYKDFDDAGNWLTQEIYLTENGVRKFINKYTREIERY